MSLNILYVENRDKDWELLERGINEWTDSGEGEQLVVDRARDIDELKRKLNLKFDVILADVFLPDPSTKDPEGVDKLDDIIKAVAEWSARQPTGRPIPIIAYTGRGRHAFEACLKRKDKLYDIWDKFASSPFYVAWRLSNLSKELSRGRPDALIQRRIREMPPGAPWHRHVVEMTKRYDEGLTELDQVERVSGPIENIARELGVRDICKALWRVMIDWEGLSRATSRKIRGHSRHVINVFWLGYYLIYHEKLQPFFKLSWESILGSRSDTRIVKEIDALESLSTAWFYAGLFHDVGGCIEKASQVSDFQLRLLRIFDRISPALELEPVAEDLFMERADEWLHDFEKPLRDLIEQQLRNSIHENKPDQGVVAAIHLRDHITENPQAFYVREGARAISMHNLYPQLEVPQKATPFNWTDEPLVCLLLLCDQLQTWDRERGDDTLKDDFPSRAELSALEITDGLDGKPDVQMTVDYIAPEHLFHAPEIYQRVKWGLDEILGDHPHRALDKLLKPWPFSLRVNCTLSGDPLETTFTF